MLNAEMPHRSLQVAGQPLQPRRSAGGFDHGAGILLDHAGNGLDLARDFRAAPALPGR